MRLRSLHLRPFYVSLGLALAFLVPSLAQEKAAEKATGKRLFWHVATEKTEAWLLGSVHAGKEDFYPLPKEIRSAYKKSQALVVEADITAGDQAQLQGLIAEKGLCKEGDSLSKHISKETAATLREKLGATFDALETAKPWFAAVQVEQVQFMKLGMRSDLGIDQHFLEKAHGDNKTIIELEGVAAQLDLLAGLSDDLQEKFLVSSVKEDDKAKEELEQLMDAWKQGDAKKMEEVEKSDLKEHPDLKPVMDKLIDERNVEMAKKIEGFLAGDKGPHFVVVGSAHLVGEKGVVSLLEKTAKYKIEQVAVTEPEKKKDGK
jgi:uncharacterized protein YbaP (TraB family)